MSKSLIVRTRSECEGNSIKFPLSIIVSSFIHSKKDNSILRHLKHFEKQIKDSRGITNLEEDKFYSIISYISKNESKISPLSRPELERFKETYLKGLNPSYGEYSVIDYPFRRYYENNEYHKYGGEIE